MATGTENATRLSDDTGFARLDSGSAPPCTPPDSECSSRVDIGGVLGPPLDFLPKDIEPQDLDAYRADYQAFRSGKAAGARGEIAALCRSPSELALKEMWARGVDRPRYKTSQKKPFRIVPLIGLNLATSSAAQSAVSAASEHLKQMASWSGDCEDFNESSHDSACDEEDESLPAMKQLLLFGDASHIQDRNGAMETSSQTNSIRTVRRQHTEPASPSKGKPSKKLTLLRRISYSKEPTQEEAQRDEAYGADAESLNQQTLEDSPLPWQRSTSSPVTSQAGVGFFVQIIVSSACLMPCLLANQLSWYSCLSVPVSYVGVTALAALREGRLTASKFSFKYLLARALRMERLVRENCVPKWFPALALVFYVLIAFQLAVGRSFSDVSSSRRISFWNANPQRHDYNCWGSELEDIADCVLVRHSGCTMLVSFYTCLLVTAVCNRNVKGSNIVAEHRKCLQELFPVQAPQLLSYVERSVESNATFWRTHKRYKVQSLALSFAWTLMSFGVYTELLQQAQTKLAKAVFLTALPCTFMLQYMLLRHVLLRVLLHLEGVKARAAAMAYCDEEGVLPFASGHAIYVWYCVRRNVQAQNEVAYQNTSPIFAASLLCAAACSCWVVTELSRRGMSVFALTSRGGASLMVVASAMVSSTFVGVFLGTLLDIGKLEEAHARQLRIAHLRLEHAKLFKKANKSETTTSKTSGIDSQTFLHDPPRAGTSSRKRDTHELDEELALAAGDLDGALAMIERVITLLEHHDAKPAFFGVEIGSKSFQVVYAALLSNLWYLCVWGVLIPLMNVPAAEDERS